MKGTRGFTLVEIIVVVAVLGIIAGIVLVNLSTAAGKSRDGDRQADLRTLQVAVELYKQRNGRYPDGCNGPNVWSGQVGTSYACNRNNGIYAQYVGSGQFIIGHATEFNFAPQFIPAIPSDKRLNGANSGYVYTTNDTGTVYKIMAKSTVESEEVDYTHPFKSCDVTSSEAGICDITQATGGRPTHCVNSDPNFPITYAVWGGFANGLDGTGANSIEHNTEKIICDIP